MKVLPCVYSGACTDSMTLSWAMRSLMSLFGIVMASKVLKRGERGTASVRKRATLMIPQKLEIIRRLASNNS